MDGTNTPSAQVSQTDNPPTPTPSATADKPDGKRSIWDRFPGLKEAAEGGSMRKLLVVGDHDVYDDLVDAIQHDKTFAKMPHTGKVKTLGDGEEVYQLGGAQIGYWDEPNTNATGTGQLKGITSKGLWMENTTGGLRRFDEHGP